MRVVVVAFSSARMLAELAAADGWEVVAFDQFGDVDLRAVAAGATARTGDELAALAAGVDADAFAYGGGPENRPDVVDALSQGRELLGVSPACLLAVRDPWTLGAAARAAGARAPETRPAVDPPAGAGRDAGRWLAKPLCSGGGRAVRRWAGGRLRPTEIIQRRIDGLPCSAVAIADGARAAVLGLTEQLHRPRTFGWLGNVTPPRLPAGELDELDGQLDAVCAEVAARFGVAGAFSVDAVWDGHYAWVLEVNPRPTAALELFESGTFAAHVRAVRGEGLPSPAELSAAETKVKLVLFAEHDLRAPDPAWWPPGLVRDIPHAGEVIRRGAPVCTLIAGADVGELAARGGRLLATLYEPVAVHG